MTRQELIDICQMAIVDVSEWGNRDTPSSQEKVGILWALLRANCHFELLYEEDGLCTDDKTIWVRVWWPRFGNFDWEGFDLNDKETLPSDTFYLPTCKRLEARNGGDWY